jgi:hypothetical protein
MSYSYNLQNYNLGSSSGFGSFTNMLGSSFGSSSNIFGNPLLGSSSLFNTSLLSGYSSCSSNDSTGFIVANALSSSFSMMMSSIKTTKAEEAKNSPETQIAKINDEIIKQLDIISSDADVNNYTKYTAAAEYKTETDKLDTKINTYKNQKLEPAKKDEYTKTVNLYKNWDSMSDEEKTGKTKPTSTEYNTAVTALEKNEEAEKELPTLTKEKEKLDAKIETRKKEIEAAQAKIEKLLKDKAQAKEAISEEKLSKVKISKSQMTSAEDLNAKFTDGSLNNGAEVTVSDLKRTAFGYANETDSQKKALYKQQFNQIWDRLSIEDKKANRKLYDAMNT